jgi:hypothetical protein
MTRPITPLATINTNDTVTFTSAQFDEIMGQMWAMTQRLAALDRIVGAAGPSSTSATPIATPDPQVTPVFDAKKVVGIRLASNSHAPPMDAAATPEDETPSAEESVEYRDLRREFLAEEPPRSRSTPRRFMRATYITSPQDAIDPHDATGSDVPRKRHKKRKRKAKEAL